MRPGPTVTNASGRGHLNSADGDHRAAFAAYEAELRPYVAENQAKGREAVAMFGGGDPQH
jgi:hypothetical protein